MPAEPVWFVLVTAWPGPDGEVIVRMTRAFAGRHDVQVCGSITAACDQLRSWLDERARSA